MSSDALQVEVAGLNIVVSGGGFCAVYYKATNQPQLILRLRTKTDDHELLARAWDGRLCQGARTRVHCVNDEARRNAGDDRHRAWDANCPRNRTVVCVRLFGELGNSGCLSAGKDRCR